MELSGDGMKRQFLVQVFLNELCNLVNDMRAALFLDFFPLLYDSENMVLYAFAQLRK